MEAGFNPILTVLRSGEATPSDPVSKDYPFQTSATVTADPKDPGNYMFLNWKGDADGNTAPASVYMDRPKTVTAVFRAIGTLKDDNDKDGRTPDPNDPVNGQDCDDEDANRFPGNTEIAGDGKD